MFDLSVTPLYLMESFHGCQPIGGINYSNDCSGNMQIAVLKLYLIATQVPIVTDQPCLPKTILKHQSFHGVFVL